MAWWKMEEAIEAKQNIAHVPHQAPQKRDRTQINADILRICLPGAKKTHIVYQANLNFKILKTYLHRLTNAGLLEKALDRYYTTDAGTKYIYHVEQLATCPNR